jgi:hypothetical protein
LPDAGKGEITQLLGRWEQGEPDAVESLAPLVYDQLRATYIHVAPAFAKMQNTPWFHALKNRMGLDW